MGRPWSLKIGHEVIGKVPHGLFLMTAAHDDEHVGVLSTEFRSAQPIRFVVVSIPKGTSIEPLLRDSRSFGLCRIIGK